MALTIELDHGTDGRWIAAVPERPGCLAYGATRLEAVRAVLDLLDAQEMDRPAEPPEDARVADLFAEPDLN
jgi:predicted RNase H-like HicB family nuclease